MTTSVIYASSYRGQDIQYGQQVSNGVTAATIYANLTSFLTTKVTQTRFTNATGSTTNPTATFGATPANGSALIAVICRTADNAATTAPSGWTLLTSAGTTGRQVAAFWKRAGAAEPTVVTATNATAAAWNMTIIEYGGWATLADPVVISAAATVTSSTTVSAGPSTGMMAGIIGLVAGSTWTSISHADLVGNNASRTALASTTQAYVSEVIGYNNSEDATTQFTLGTARGTHRLVVGWPHNTTSIQAGVGVNVGVTQTSGTGAEGQVGIEFDTTPIYALNTVSSATLTLKTGTLGTWPATADSEIFNINSTAIAKTASNTRTLWRTPTEITALTRVASRPAGTSTAANTAYAWTSDTAFISNINQGSTTRLLVATSEQRSGSLSITSQAYVISGTVTDHYLTIVHDRLVPITYSITASPIVTRLASLKRTVAYTITASPVVTRLASLKRTVAATITASPVVARLASLKRTIAATVTASPVVTRIVNVKKTVAATITASPTISQLRVTLRTISATITASPTVSRITGFKRTIAATVTASPVVTQITSFKRTIAATITATGTVLTTYTPFIVQLPRILRLAGRSTVTLISPSTLRLATRSTIKLVTQSTLRLVGRSGIKLPKE